MQAAAPIPADPNLAEPRQTTEEYPGAGSIPVHRGELWTSRQRAAHSLHEISYRACFKPQLPAFFFERKAPRGGTIYDPFAGRGTTLLEARLHGLHVVGNDRNPLTRILVEPRLFPPDLWEIERRLDEVRFPASEAFDEELNVFFHPRTLAEILGWKDWFARRILEGTFDRVDAWLRMVCCNRLTGHSPGFFSGYTLPPNQATSVTAQRRINEKRQISPEPRDTFAILHKKSRQLLADPLPPGFFEPSVQLLTSSADHTPEIPDSSIDLVVTSPPFLNVVDYAGDHWLRMWFTGQAVTSSELWQTSSLPLWSEKMEATLRELHRVVRPGGWIACEVGEVRRGKIRLEEQIISASLRTGLRIDSVWINEQNFTKTANCWGVDNNRKGTNTNRIVLLQA